MGALKADAYCLHADWEQGAGPVVLPRLWLLSTLKAPGRTGAAPAASFHAEGLNNVIHIAP